MRGELSRKVTDEQMHKRREGRTFQHRKWQVENPPGSGPKWGPESEGGRTGEEVRLEAGARYGPRWLCGPSTHVGFSSE